MFNFRRPYTYPAPGGEHPEPLATKYWAQSLDYVGKVDFDNTDRSESNITEQITIACEAPHTNRLGTRSQPLVTIYPLSAAQASLPRGEAPQELIVDALSAVWPKKILEAREILLSSRRGPGSRFAHDVYVVDFVQQGGDKEMDLETALAQVATAVWVEGVLLTRNTDYCMRKCIVQQRPKTLGTAGPLVLGRVDSTQSIMNPYSIFPRRLWDLVNNRVIDVDAFASPNGTPRVPVGGYWAISHSWTADMKRWMTPINNYRWPVPLPEGITFEQIRWEALRAGAVYCWLDVLCLRQRTMELIRKVDLNRDTSLCPGEKSQQLPDSTRVAEISIRQRLEEWSIDVPTIGNNYRQATHVLRYFNGLGRRLELCGWGDPRHWLNRAWTLQETRPEHIMVNGGIPGDMPLPLQALVSMGDAHGSGETQQQIRQVLAPLAHLVEDAEPDHLTEVSMVDLLWPDMLRSRQQDNTWTSRAIADMFCLLIAIITWASIYWTPLQASAQVEDPEQSMRRGETLYRVQLQWRADQAVEHFVNVKDMVAGIEAYQRIWGRWLLSFLNNYIVIMHFTIEALGLMRILEVSGLVDCEGYRDRYALSLDPQQELQDARTASQNLIMRSITSLSPFLSRLRRRMHLLTLATGTAWSLILMPLMLSGVVYEVFGFSWQNKAICDPTNFEALKALVLLGWYFIVSWFQQYVWPQVVAVFSGVWVLSRGVIRMRRWFGPMAMGYVIHIIGNGAMARWLATWQRAQARSLAMGDPKAEALPVYCSSILALVCEMSRRHASNELDKIAGLGYLMKCRTLPLYSETEDIEHAWVHLVQHLHFAAQLELLFNFPTARHNYDDTTGDIIHELGPGEHVHQSTTPMAMYRAYRSRSWIPTWKAVSGLDLQGGRSMELQRPTWPPRWLKDGVHASDLRQLCVNSAAFDHGTGALVVPVCPRVIMTKSITRDGRFGSYSVCIAGSNRRASFVHTFYCPHSYSLPLLKKQDLYLLISHARDNQAGPLSWVVGKLISPQPKYVQDAYRSGIAFGGLCNRDMGARRSEVRKYVRNLGIPNEVLAHMVLVKKVGILVTDDMRPFTAPDIDAYLWCAINIPVVFV